MITLQEKSLDWALAHVETCGDTDVFPIPFEYKAIRHNWEILKPQLAKQNILEWTVRPLRILLAPKARYGFRIITQLDPLDFLLFAATIRELCTSIEVKRVSKSVVCSYRVAPTEDGQLFNQTGYRAFLNTSRDILEKNPEISHVVVTDISDFYSRIYHHRLENALDDSTDKSGHVRAVMHLLSGWNTKETFGIPIGNSPSRLLAEITLSDVDNALLANGVQFIRFNDDYRIFAQSHAEAYRTLAFLADCLFRNRGLTLQQQKTSVLSRGNFESKYLTTPLDHELDSLHEKFDQLIADLDLDDSYEQIDYDDLTEEQKDFLDSLNLKGLLNEQIHEKSEIEIPTVRFLLRRLARIGDSSMVDVLLDNLDTLHPVFPDIIRYIEQLEFPGDESRTMVGEKLLDVYKDSIVGELEYHKLWCLNLFSTSRKWSRNKSFSRLHSEARDDPSKRKLILAMGRAGEQYWFQNQWRNLTNFPPWLRRAVLAGASCMPTDARKHWYRSIEPQLDILEYAVIKWAQQHPFSKE